MGKTNFMLTVFLREVNVIFFKYITGKAKGQGQEKDVVRNRDYKHVHKSARGNHNRRVMAARKRQQGMMPS